MALDFDLFDEDTEADEAASQTARYLADSEQHLGRMLELMPIGVLIHSEQAIVFANHQASAFIGSTAKLLRGQHLLDFVASSDSAGVADCVRSAFAAENGSPSEIEAAFERRDGTSRLMRVITARLPWQGTPVIQVLMQDITEQKRAETSLRQMTITDELTGSYNRRHALYEANLHLEAAKAGGPFFSVLSLDIDHFKSVNDTHGHDIGDLVLKSLAQRAADFLATRTELNSAIFARMGGEEFLFLLPGTSLKHAVSLGNQFRLAVESMRFDLPETVLKITLSAGAAAYRTEHDSVDSVLKQADLALYSAKARGRNRVCTADNS